MEGGGCYYCEQLKMEYIYIYIFPNDIKSNSLLISNMAIKKSLRNNMNMLLCME